MEKRKKPVAESHEAHVLPMTLWMFGGGSFLAIIFGLALTAAVVGSH